MPVNKEDFELLSLAALAAGYSFDKYTLKNDKTGFEYAGWNPLENDGDAFRLAVHLRMNICHYSGCTDAHDRVGVNNGYGIKPVPYKDDILKAVRRVVVLAAAEIGKDVK